MTPTILTDHVTAAERLASPRKRKSDPAWESCGGRDITGAPLHVATERVIDAMGTAWCCHESHSPKRTPPAGLLAKAIMRQRWSP